MMFAKFDVSGRAFLCLPTGLLGGHMREEKLQNVLNYDIIKGPTNHLMTAIVYCC